MLNRIDRKHFIGNDNLNDFDKLLLKEAWNTVVRKCERIAIESSDFLRNVKKLKVK